MARLTYPQIKVIELTAEPIIEMLPKDNTMAVATLALALYKVGLDRGMMVEGEESAKFFIQSFALGFMRMAVPEKKNG